MSIRPATVSVTAFDLYLSIRLTTVKSVSRAGLVTPR